MISTFSIRSGFTSSALGGMSVSASWPPSTDREGERKKITNEVLLFSILTIFKLIFNCCLQIKGFNKSSVLKSLQKEGNYA